MSPVQRLRLDREIELLDVLPDDDLLEDLVPDDFADLDRDAFPPDDLFAVDLPALVDRVDEREPALLRLAVFPPPLFFEEELDDARFEDEPAELLLDDRDLPLPADLAADDERFAFELGEDDFALAPEERLPPLMLPTSAVCTTFAASSTAPIAALVRSVPATSAAFDNNPVDRRLLLLDF